MVKQSLEEYRSKKAEIQELQYKLAHLGEGDSLIGNDTVFDYSTGYPRPQSVVGYDLDRERRLRASWEKRMGQLAGECLEVELWIEAIPDSLTRRIFRMCFMDGLTQKEVAKIIYLDRSSISKKIDGYIKDSHNSQDAHV